MLETRIVSPKKGIKHEKDWGYEIWHENNHLYCLKTLHIKEHHQCSLHYHKLKDETFLILEGALVLYLIYGDFFDTIKIDDERLDDRKSNYCPFLDRSLRIPKELDLQRFILAAGDSFRLSPNVAHFFASYYGDCTFIESSTTHYEWDSYRLFRGGKINNLQNHRINYYAD